MIQRARSRCPSVVGDIVFDDVSFAYSTGEPVLSGISFHADIGTVTALVGSSGSGKSTIIGLVAGFYRPTHGRVLVDGVDLSTVRLESYRSELGAVLQDPFLFDGTIRENVAFSRATATDASIRKACDIAHVTEFAERLAGKYETVVGERGVRLSGGQRQRISIARAVVADPRILILDEATSSLDSESEFLIQDGLRAPDAWPNDPGYCSPPVDHPLRRSDSGCRGRPHCRARRPRNALRCSGAIPPALRAPAPTRCRAPDRRRRSAGKE